MDQDYLKAIIEYNHLTGVFKWLKSKGSVKSGDIAGSSCPKGYMEIRINGKTYRAHRLALLYFYGEFPREQIDHINMNKSDNRIENLRLATNSENACNKIKCQSNNHTGFLGVSFDKRSGKYRAQISINKKQVLIGYFKDAITAHEQYLKAKRENHSHCTI